MNELQYYIKWTGNPAFTQERIDALWQKADITETDLLPQELAAYRRNQTFRKFEAEYNAADAKRSRSRKGKRA